MNITKTQPDALTYQVTIDIEAADYAEALRHRLNEYKRKADIKGFRRGMAPMSLIQRFYGDEALYQSVNTVLSEQLDKFIKDEGIRVIGEPMPSEDQPQLKWENGESFCFKFDIAQTSALSFEVGKDDKIPYYDINVTQEAKKNARNQLLEQYGQLVEGNKAGEKDYVIVDIANDEHKAEGVYVAIPNVAEAARSNFIGLKAGDKVVVNVNEAFENETDRAAMLKVDKERLATLNPVFDFTVVNVKTFEAAKEGQETYDKIFGEGVVTTPEQFEEKIAERVKNSYEQEANYRFGTDARNYFVQKSGIQIPEDFLKRYLVYVNEGKMSAQEVEAEFTGFAESYKWQLVRDYLMEKFQIRVAEADLLEAASAYVTYQYAMYGMAGMPKDLIEGAARNMLADENQARRIREQVEDNKTIARIREEVTLQTKKISLDKFKELK